jgi:predicted DNA-binding antitoxin AbrB/MazE fold protein
MTLNIEAVYDHGVFRPVEPVVLPEGARVQVQINPATNSSNGTAEYNGWLDGLAGLWQGEFARDGEGHFETREPLS